MVLKDNVVDLFSNQTGSIIAVKTWSVNSVEMLSIFEELM